MPSGQTHATFTMGMSVVSVVFGIALRFPTLEILYLFLGFMFTLFVNPDLDLNTRFPRKDPKKWLWWVYWWPYSRLVPHRHPVSHAPILSTFLRIAYIGLPLLPFIPVDRSIVPFFVGAVISDTLHAVMDVVSTGIKRKFS